MIHPRSCRAAFGLAALLGLAQPLSAQQPASPLPAWMAGCWREASAGHVVDEVWLSPAGDALTGMSRTVRNDTLRSWEQLVIRRAPAGLVLEAAPSNQPPASFAATLASDTLVVFENPSHDFPQIIRYQRRGRDSLIATVSGTIRDRQRTIEFDYARVACPGP